MYKVSKEIMIKIGIDVSKDKLDCAWIRSIDPLKIKTKIFKNDLKGFQGLIDWVLLQTKQPIESIHFIMEATGIYHEALAHELYQHDAKISVVNPAWIKNYGKSLGVLTKTDKKDSVIIGRYGVTQSPRLWRPEAPEIRQLKSLINRYGAIDKDIQRELNRLEKEHISNVSEEVIKSIQTVISQLKEERKRIEKLITQHIDQSPRLKQDIKYLESIPGVGPVVSRYMLVTIHSRDFISASQCSAYVGLNPVQFESGSSIKKRSRLSKSGSSKIRAKLYMAAIVAKTYNPDIKQQYDRLLKRGKAKMCAIGAAMRKLVQICFGVLKHQTPYQPQTL